MTETSNDMRVDPEVLIASAEELEPVAYRLRSQTTVIGEQFRTVESGDLHLNGQADPIVVTAIQRSLESLNSATLAARILAEVVQADSFSLVETAFAFQEADLEAAEHLERTAPGLSVDGGYR